MNPEVAESLNEPTTLPWGEIRHACILAQHLGAAGLDIGRPHCDWTGLHFYPVTTVGDTRQRERVCKTRLNAMGEITVDAERPAWKLVRTTDPAEAARIIAEFLAGDDHPAVGEP